MKKNRIWELDAFRGLCLIGMVIVHGIYDVVELYGLIPWQYPPVFLAVRGWGGGRCLLLSGIPRTVSKLPLMVRNDTHAPSPLIFSFPALAFGRTLACCPYRVPCRPCAWASQTGPC